MKKGKRLFSYLGSGFAFSMLFGLAAFLPEAKAEAALQVQEINYEDSTIKIKSDSGDKILYFSDKNKKKWEMSVDPFNSGVCTMDISWVSTTKDYMLTFKGDKSTDILSVTLPKQVTNFKAKYNQATGEVTFTNQGSREVQYRKNGTDTWKPYDIAENKENKENLKDSLQRLCENGASVYFRLISENGTSESVVGQRPSKEVACKINKKSTAPTVTIDTTNSTIAVQSGWEWRTAGITEKSGVQYTTTNSAWEKFSSGRDVPLSELAPEAVYKEDRSDLASEVKKEDIYLQFRKSATASTQLSYITTIKVPAQDKAPTIEEAGASFEYTSKTSFRLTFSAASSNNPYEYCIVDSDDLRNGMISDMESVEWKGVTSAASTEIKKKEAPENSAIFFRKKAIGKVGDDNFKLASPYTKFKELEYNFTTSKEINKDYYVFDGVCKTGNSDGEIMFSFESAFKCEVESISLSQTKEIEGTSKVTINSSVTANKNTASENDKYIVTTTMTNIELSSDIKSILDQKGELILYAYIKLSNGDPIESNDNKGIRIHIKPQSSIDKNTTSYSGDKEYAYNVSRFVGTKVPTQGSIGTDQYQNFHFKIDMGAEYGSSLGEYCKEKTMDIESVQLGNYQLQAGSDYEYNSTTEMFTVHLEKFETNPAVVSSYNTTQNLIIKLTNGEKLTDANIKLIPPVALDKNYVWAFTHGQLPIKTTTTITSSSGQKEEKEENINTYSIKYAIGRGNSSEMSIKQCVLKSVKLNGENILLKTEEEEIIFSNILLNKVDPGTHNVEFVFDITYSNGMVQTYTINQGCMFTIM